MVTAIILMNIEREQVNEVAQKIVDLESVTEIFSVSGRYDLVTIVRVKDNDGIADFVTNHLATTKGIITTETLLAFRTFSKFDLERLFSIGG